VLQAEKVESPGTTPSYYAWGVEQIAGDIKESAARVSEMAFDASENANIPTVSYEVGGMAPACRLVPQNPGCLACLESCPRRCHPGFEARTRREPCCC